MLGRAEAVIETRRDTKPEHGFASHEHRELAHGVDRMHEVGVLLGTTDDLAAAALEIIHWVDAVLEPHARWEDRWLYPEIDRRAGTPWATKLMSFEHQQIRDAAHDLGRARTALRETHGPAAVIEVRARLFALEAIVRAHMAREERFLLPLLDGDGPQLGPVPTAEEHSP
jgi:hemerythrin-like domain-containing protein